jgi:hypothetical protein
VGIQPIDLQTLYSQLDKIGKSQVQQNAAAQAARDSEMVTNRLETERRLKSIQETEAGDEQAGTVHEREGSGKEEHSPSRDDARGKKKDAEETVEPEKEVLRDPNLGSIIDISG